MSGTEKVKEDPDHNSPAPHCQIIASTVTDPLVEFLNLPADSESDLNRTLNELAEQSNDLYGKEIQMDEVNVSEYVDPTSGQLSNLINHPLHQEQANVTAHTTPIPDMSLYPKSDGLQSFDGNISEYEADSALRTAAHALYAEYAYRMSAVFAFANFHLPVYFPAACSQPSGSLNNFDIPLLSVETCQASQLHLMPTEQPSDSVNTKLDPSAMHLDEVSDESPDTVDSDTEMPALDGELIPFRSLKAFSKSKDRKTPWTEDEIQAARLILTLKQLEWGVETVEIERILQNPKSHDKQLCLRRKALKQAFQACDKLKNRRPDVVFKTLLTGCFALGTGFKISQELGRRIKLKFPDHIKFKTWTNICKMIQEDDDFSPEEKQGLALKERGPERLRTFFKVHRLAH